MTQRKPKEPVAFLYRGVNREPSHPDELSHRRLDNYYRPAYSSREHDYIKGEALVLQSEWEPRVLLANERQARVYIAGPMTGIDDYNFPAFNAKEAELRAVGFEVENPTAHGIVEGATWTDYMAYDLARLALCNTIYMLPGWAKSKGASIERQLALDLGMTVLGAEE